MPELYGGNQVKCRAVSHITWLRQRIPARVRGSEYRACSHAEITPARVLASRVIHAARELADDLSQEHTLGN
jgi:hypothetical protein